MRYLPLFVLFLFITLLPGCGIPREAAQLAASHVAAPLPADDAGVRAALRAQADDWTHLGGLLLRSGFGGIRAGAQVNAKFTTLVLQTAALARRQRDLIDHGQDDPQQNRAILERLRSLWASADAYLQP
jgi:hypothetical protein